MSAIPEPLTPSNCDLRDFRWMKLDIVALFNSDFNMTADDTAWRAGVTLWGRAWHQVPAGSLPNDELTLCNLAGFGRDMKTWRRIRNIALRGFILCTDGRLYHTFLCPMAKEAHEEKCRFEKRRAADRERKRAGVPSEADTTSAGIPPEAPLEEAAPSDGIPAENAVDVEVEGEQKVSPPIIPPKGGKARRQRSERIRGRIPVDWHPDEAGMVFAAERDAPADERAIADFRDHHIAHGSVMADWAAAWRTWCGNARRFGRALGQGPPTADGRRDPWGVDAWIARQSDAKDDVAGPANRPCKVIGGLAADLCAKSLAEAAGLPLEWRGSWDALGEWLRAGIDVGALPVLNAVTGQARTMRDRGSPIGSIAVFNIAVRNAGHRRQA